MSCYRFFTIVFSGLALTLLPACSQPAPAPKPEESKPPTESRVEEHAEEAGHAHDEEHGHDEEHEHKHEAPRGGTLVELGDHVAHVEFLHDAAAGRLSGYFLDAHCENPVRLPDATVAITVDLRDGKGPIALSLSAKANDLTGETVGDTSEFFVEDTRLKGVSAFDITLTKVTARGASFENLSFPFPEGKQ